MRRLLFGVLCVAVPCLAGSTELAPAWAMQAHARPLPAYSAEVGSVTVLDEGEAVLDAGGTLHRTLRYAVRVLTVDGRKETKVGVPYLKGKTKITDLRAWLITADGNVKAYGKESVLDIGIKQDFELYDEYRERVIEAHNAPVGSTFVYSAAYDESLLTLEDSWHFQTRDPVLLSRYTITVPNGWTAIGTVFNSQAIQFSHNGSSYTWEAKELPHIKKEPCSPSFGSVAPWLGVSFLPNSGAEAAGRAIATWTDVSNLQWNLASKQADSSDALASKVNQLTGSAAGPLSKIQALGSYVQQIKYVEIATNLARGGGYIPHAASQVFAKQYGDCKDKANLLRAMLKQAGIESYLVAVFSGDRYYVHPEWASVGQFNHMIIAIAVPDTVSAPAVLVQPGLGRLLFFDPTDPFTPVGELPEEEQGSQMLMIAGAKGGLVKAPVAQEEANRMSVDVAASLAATGALEAQVDLVTNGDPASHLRALHTYMKAKDMHDMLERWVAASAKQSELDHVDAKDDPATHQFALALGLHAPSYGQVMQGKMLVFRPAVVRPLFRNFEIQPDARVHPVVLPSECFHQQVHVKLPAGFTVEEIPDAVQFTTPFGKFASSYTVSDGTLVFSEDLDVPAALLPAASYAEVKLFFQHVAGAEQAPLLLMKN